MRQKFHFELKDGTRVGSWETRDIGNPTEKLVLVGTLVVIGGKRFTIEGYRRPVHYAEAWDRIILVMPYVPQ